MQRDKGSTGKIKKRMVWRITDAAPKGEMVDASAPATPPAPDLPASDAGQPGWAMSSIDLLTGIEVTEDDRETVPDDLFDELFKKSE